MFELIVYRCSVVVVVVAVVHNVQISHLKPMGKSKPILYEISLEGGGKVCIRSRSPDQDGRHAHNKNLR